MEIATKEQTQIMKKIIILLTSCISPGQIYNTALLDSEERLKQYLEALTFYLENTVFNIIFVDNSNVNISDLFERYIVSGRLEILQFEGDKASLLLGKGYGEMEILEYALLNSKKIVYYTTIIKITGRLKLLNINYLVNIILKMKRIDSFISADFMLNFNAANSRIFLGNLDFISNFLIPLKCKVNDEKHYFFEHALGEALHAAISQNYQFVPFPIFTRFEGVSGTSSKIYTPNTVNYIVRSTWCFFKSILFRFKYSS